MGRLERIRVYPVKSFDGLELEVARITEGGVLEYDREYALIDDDQDLITGRRESRIHELQTDFDPQSHVLTVQPPQHEPLEFDLRENPEEAADWFGDFFDTRVAIRRDTMNGFVDRPHAGPSVISTGTLREVSTWYDELSVGELRRRFRANIEISGVPAFWEDRFVGVDSPMFRIGDVQFAGVEPCIRCVVPERDPDTGERMEGFREQFIQRRPDSFPSWVDESAFKNDYSLMLIAKVLSTDRGQTLRVGDQVTIHTEKQPSIS